MSEVNAPRLQLMQARDRDPLFDGATYQYALGSEAGEIMVSVRVAPIFVHLLPLARRQRLREIADEVVLGAAGDVQDDDEIVVTSDGAVRLGSRVLRRLLPPGDA